MSGGTESKKSKSYLVWSTDGRGDSITGLNDDDALSLWRAQGVSGSRDALLPMFNSFENHPLLLQALVAEVARYRPAPRNFDRWRQDHPEFDPFSLPLASRRTHVLDFALRGLEEAPRRVLHTMAAFRMPGTYDTLQAPDPRDRALQHAGRPGPLRRRFRRVS